MLDRSFQPLNIERLSLGNGKGAHLRRSDAKESRKAIDTDLMYLPGSDPRCSQTRPEHASSGPRHLNQLIDEEESDEQWREQEETFVLRAEEVTKHLPGKIKRSQIRCLK